MDKQVSNKGYTLIEMIFVLMIAILMMSLSLFHYPDSSQIKFELIKEILYDVQYDSLSNHKVNEIEFYKHTMIVNNHSIDLTPLSCEPLQFHYNKQGNISQANTLHCKGNKQYELTLQLGTGWISYE